MVTKSSKISRIAIIGLGSIGKKHFKVIKKLRPDIKIVLIRSGYGKKCQEENLAEYIFQDIKDLDLKVDAVIISSPAPFHLMQAKNFIKKRIPVFIEKPLSNKIEKINEFKTFCKKFNALILIGYVLRYSKSLIFFRRLVSKINIGKHDRAIIECHSYLPNWRPETDYRKSLSARKELGGGVLLELSHELDYSNWIFGPFKKINAKIINSGKLDIDVEDEAKLKLVSKNNLNVFINLSFNSKKNKRSCKLIGSKGTLYWDCINNYVEYDNLNGKTKKWKFKNKNKNILFENQIKHFFKCVEKKLSPRVSLNDGIEALRLALNAKKNSNIN